MRAVSYESFYYKFKSQFKWFSKRWLQQERVAYESGRKEGYDCNKILQLLQLEGISINYLVHI